MTVAVTIAAVLALAVAVALAVALVGDRRAGERSRGRVERENVARCAAQATVAAVHGDDRLERHHRDQAARSAVIARLHEERAAGPWRALLSRRTPCP